MARVLIVGGGCRGRVLAGELVGAGHAVRATTRDPGLHPAIAATGAEPFAADPDRVGTLVPALAGTAVLCWLLGTVTGEAARALHGPRLRAMLEKVVDSPVRGVVYETATAAGAETEAQGRAEVERAAETWRIPVALLDADPADRDAWAAAVRGAIERLLSVR